MKTDNENIKVQIAAKHGIINGFTIHSNPEIARRNLYNAMDEYTEYVREKLDTDNKSNIVTVEQRVVEILDDDITFNGHPSRLEAYQERCAIQFLAKQIDILHKIRIGRTNKKTK